MRRKHLDFDEPLRHEGHRKPVSRRDFLAQGFIAGAGMVMSPSLLGLLGRSGVARAQAANCGIGIGGSGKIPFVCFDLAGGANMVGSNALVGGPGGQLDLLSEEGYIKQGLPTGMHPTDPAQINTELGLAFHVDSAFLRGIMARTSAATRAKINGTVLCTRSNNDTGNNPHNPMYGINKAGADGDLVTLVGSENSESGGNSDAPMAMIDPAVRPTKIDRPEDATGLVDTGKLVALLDQADAQAVMAAVEGLSQKKVDKMNEGALVEELFQCSYAQTTDLVSRFGNPDALDPRLDPDIAAAAGSIFTLQELNNDSKFRKTGSIMKLVVEGFAGAGTVEFGGYDYHNGTRATGEVRDFEAGECMGAVMEFAARRGTPVVVYVMSDGSLDSDGEIDNSADGRGKGTWRGDNSSTAASIMFVYDPNAVDRPLLTTPTANQIGYFRMNGSVETAATPISNNVEQLVEAVVLNYLALHGDAGMLDMVLPGHGLGAGAIRDALVAFQPLPMT